jgi:RNase adaptor protein for sRNA GlmZ degradation
MRCDQLTRLEADRTANLLRCPSCGSTRPLPSLPLFVVTGASGAGKSTIVDGLRRRLPDCEVFETDLILQVAELGWDRWQDTWLLLAYGIALNGRATVLCGSLQPEQLEPLPARPLVGEICFCNLDCPDEVLAERLRARPAWRDWNAERIAEHQRFAASLRSRIDPTFDTSTCSVEEVADQVAHWVTGHLHQ